MKYTITIRNPNLEEYDGGNTLEEARKEARFFALNTPSHVPVRICTVDVETDRLIVKEIVR